MARPGQTIENPATGERITFVAISAGLLVMDDVWVRPGHRTPEHIHPFMEERWRVLSGRAAFQIAGEQLEVGPGEVVVATAGTPHLAWNPTAAAVHLRVEMRPALRWAEFTERLFGGEPPADLLHEFRREISLTPGTPEAAEP